jgi:hypothetical protein
MPAHDVNARAIGWSAAAIAVTIVVCVAAVFALLHFWRVPPGADRGRPAVPLRIPGPVLQPAPQLDLAQYRAEKEQQLHAIGWVDAAHGIAHIPIESAMDLLAQRSAAAASAAGGTR